MNLRMRKLASKAVFALALFLWVAEAPAASIMFSDDVFLQTTNFNSSVSIPKFDSNLGTLDKITFKLGGHVEGQAKFESLDGAPTTVEMQLAAQIKLQRPDLSVLVVALPMAMTSDMVTAFDGVADFGGTSGMTYPALSANQVEMTMTVNPVDFALFTGGGNIVLPVMATGASSGSGAGNLLLQFNTSASANVMVTYDYTVPEPATAAFIAMGAVCFFRRRR